MSKILNKKVKISKHVRVRSSQHKHRVATTTTRPTHFRAFEEARDAVVTLRVLKPLLTKQDAETLSILMDKELISHIDKSLEEARSDMLEPIQSIFA